MIALCNLREFQADALINPYERCSKELRLYGIKLHHKIEVQGEGSRQSNRAHAIEEAQKKKKHKISGNYQQNYSIFPFF